VVSAKTEAGTGHCGGPEERTYLSLGEGEGVREGFLRGKPSGVIKNAQEFACQSHQDKGILVKKVQGTEV